MIDDDEPPAGHVFALAVLRKLGDAKVYCLLPGESTRSYSRSVLQTRAADFGTGVEVIAIADLPFVQQVRP